MADIIKTWPRAVTARVTARLFSETNPPFVKFYFTLGRGRPHQQIDRIWFTYQGRILGYFHIETIVVNDGTLPRLRSIENEESEWQIRKDAKVAICSSPCVRLRERLFMDGFRGWRYFDVDAYRAVPESRWRTP